MTARMDHLGVTQTALADTTGIPLTTLHRALRAQGPFNLDQLDRVAEALGTTAQALVADAEVA